MEVRKWEDLDFDCLVNVLRRVGMESLVFDAPFVCKSWYKASLDPLCWENLVFPQINHPFWSRQKVLSALDFVKLIVDRSQGTCKVFDLPVRCHFDVPMYMADRCPGLRSLSLPCGFLYRWGQDFRGKSPVKKWKHLNNLEIGGSVLFDLIKLVTEIGIHCKNFQCLTVSVAPMCSFPRDIEDLASAISTHLPKIKKLFLKGAEIRREGLVMILQACRDLEELDVANCVIRFEVDSEILDLSRHINNFKFSYHVFGQGRRVFGHG